MPNSVPSKGSKGISLEVFIVLAGLLAGVGWYLAPAPDVHVKHGASANQAVGGTLVIQQSSQVYDAIIRYINDGGVQSLMTLDTHPRTGLFAPYFESGPPPVAPKGAFEPGASHDAKWFLNNQMQIKPGDDEWFALILPGIKKPLCQRLNTILHKDDVNAEPAPSVYTKEQWIGGAVVLEGADPRLARRDGCAAAGSGDYVFYRMMVRR